MNLCYVFTEEQVTPLNEYLDGVRDDYPNYTIIIPCPIKNNLFILPYPIFDEPEFSYIKDGVQPYLDGVEVRVVEPSEYPDGPKVPSD